MVKRAPSFGFKASETLLGIETISSPCSTPAQICFKASETLLGIETSHFAARVPTHKGFKASETLLGIETFMHLFERLELYQLQSL